MLVCSRLRVGFALSMLFAGCLSAQDGSIRGTVSDLSGALVPDVSITATNLNTGQAVKAGSTGAGIYTIGSLPVGNYRLEAKVPGFKAFNREPVRVETATVTTVDIPLEVGQASESVTVEGAVAPLMQTDNAEVSTVVEEKFVLDLPLDIGKKTTTGGGSGRRQIEDFIFLTPGVTGDQWGKHILGSTQMTNQNIIDGIPYTPQETPGTMASTSPPYEAVEEFKMSTTMFPASVGRGLGVTSYTIKSGTNGFHGDAYWILRNDKFDARGFFAQTKPAIRQNETGARIGGPIFKNKTFFFFSYQDFRKRGGTGGTIGLDTIPPTAFRQGDFSQLKDQNGALIPIFDPATTRSDGQGGFVRDAFPNNQIPASRFDPVAVKVLGTLPKPDLPGIVNNWYSRATSPGDDRDLAFKLDHQLTSQQHLSGSFWRTVKNPYGYSDWGGAPPDTGTLSTVSGNAWRANWDWVMRPNVIHHFGAGGLWNDKHTGALSSSNLNGNPFGIPGVPNTSIGFPTFNLGSTSSSIIGKPVLYLQIGNAVNLAENTFDRSTIFTDNVSWTTGKHTWVFGGDLWFQQFQRYDRRNGGGVFNVTPLSTSQPNSPNFAQWGEPVASFLLGQIFSGDIRLNPVPATYHTKYFAVFAEDKFQVTPKLTLNLGLRYDVPWAIREANNRIAMVDPGKPNPAAGNRPGAYVFGNDAVVPKLDLREFSPRIGMAYRLDNKTVIRSGFALIYGQSNALSSGQELNGNSLLTGYRAEYLPTSLDNGITPAFVLSQGLPPLNVTFPLLDPGLAVGGVADYIAPNAGHAPNTVNYNFIVQREVGWGTVVDLGYVGAKGSRLAANIENFNQVPAQYLALGSTLLAQVGSAQANAAGITAPYPGFKGSVAQALRPFPQYTNWTTHANAIGNMSYHSLQAKVQKRFSAGLGILVSYTLSKTITDTGSGALWASVGNASLDTGNRRLEKSVASYDQTHVLVANLIYELPLTKRTSGLRSRALRGWQVASTLSYSSGFPIGVTGGSALPLFGASNRPVSIPGVPQSQWGGDPATSRYLNRGAFMSSAPFTFGTVGKNLPTVRLPFNYEEDAILSKRTYFERFNIEFRGEFYNIFNRAIFGGPGTDFNNAQSFGVIGTQGNYPRTIQFSLKFNF